MKQKLGKIWELYQNLAAPVKASLWFTICNIVQKGISLLSTPIFTRIMTPEQYGVYTVYQSWYSILFIFATLNLGAGVYNNGMTKYADDRPRYTSALQGLSTTVTAILFIIYLLNISFWNRILGLSTLFVLVMFAEMLFVPAYDFWAAGQRYDYKYRNLVILTLAIGILTPVVGIIAVISTDYKAEARVLSYVLIQVCAGLIFYVYNAQKGKAFYVKKYWKFALAFNIPLIPHYLSQNVLNQADRIMINSMVGSAEAAIYSVAYSVSMMMTIVTNAINSTFIPYTYKAIRDEKYAALKKNANFLVLLVGAACVAAMAFGPEIIRVFAAPEYYEARWIVPPVAASLFFMFLYPLFCNVEFYYEKTIFIMIASGLAAVVNIALNYVAISIYGYIAAAYTTLICYIVLALLHYMVHRLILKEKGILQQLYDIPAFVTGSVIVLAVMVGMTLIYDLIIVRYLLILGLLLSAIWKREVILKKFQEIKQK